MPLVLLALGTGAWLLPRVEDREHAPLDPVGAAPSVPTLSAILSALFGMLFLLAPYLQLVLGYGTLAAGLSGLPVAAASIIAAPRSAVVAERFGSKRWASSGS